jgi:hypothetical protein
MKREKTINNSSRSSTIISVLMMLLMLLMLFLPLSSWSNYLIIGTDQSSDMHMMMSSSNDDSNSMPCHSTRTEIVTVEQDTCCGDTGLDVQCSGCVHNCTFVKYFSNTIDSFNSYLSQNHVVRYSTSLDNTQFPSPPFRPPAA